MKCLSETFYVSRRSTYISLESKAADFVYQQVQLYQGEKLSQRLTECTHLLFLKFYLQTRHDSLFSYLDLTSKSNSLLLFNHFLNKEAFIRIQNFLKGADLLERKQLNTGRLRKIVYYLCIICIEKDGFMDFDNFKTKLYLSLALKEERFIKNSFSYFILSFVFAILGFGCAETKGPICLNKIIDILSIQKNLKQWLIYHKKCFQNFAAL